RVAVQQTGSLTLAPLDGPMVNLWHFCTRGQLLYGLPDMANLPNIEQLWIWANGLVLDTLAPRSGAGLNSIQLSGSGSATNRVAHLDFENSTWSYGRLIAEGVSLQTLNLDGMTPIGSLRIANNLFDQAAVDYIIETVESWG